MEQGISLSQIAQGELEEKFQMALAKVLQNLTDVNTEFKKKRSINIALDFAINEQRTDVFCNIRVNTKLSPSLPAKTNMGLFKDLKTGRITIEEYGSRLRGQTKLPDETTIVDVINS